MPTSPQLPFAAVRRIGQCVCALSPAAEAASADIDAASLPAEVQSWLTGGTAHRRQLLVLDASLPDAWHDRAWESAALGSLTVSDCATVIRRGCPRFGQRPPARQRSAWIDLFPAAEHSFSGAFAPFVERERMNRVRPRWASRGLHGVDEVFILAHGSESGLLDADGRHFSLDGIVLPPRVWLLACSIDRSMQRAAETLLARGVRTVVCPTGMISAPEIAALVCDWLEASSDLALEQWLLRKGAKSTSEGGMRSLTVLGEVSLDASLMARWHEAVWEDVGNPLSRPLKMLLENDGAAFDAAAAALDSPDLWPTAYSRLFPALLATAENLDHQAMVRLHARAPATHATPSIFGALAAAAYRKGHCDGAACCIAKGLQHPMADEVDRADLLGLLANLLIDMDLPEAAAKAVARHEECRLADAALRERYELRRLDWKSRIAFRQRQFPLAVQRMRFKRERSGASGGTRELSWLLYMRAWADADAGVMCGQEAVALRDAALQHLRDADRSPERLGNNDAPYLLRAVACHAAVCRDALSLEAARAWRGEIELHLSAVDPGPWAFAALYLAMAGDDAGLATADLALDALYDADYFLETAAFAARIGSATRERAALDRFIARRVQVLDELRCFEWLSLSNPPAPVPASVLPM